MFDHLNGYHLGLGCTDQCGPWSRLFSVVSGLASWSSPHAANNTVMARAGSQRRKFEVILILIINSDAIYQIHEFGKGWSKQFCWVFKDTKRVRLNHLPPCSAIFWEVFFSSRPVVLRCSLLYRRLTSSPDCDGTITYPRVEGALISGDFAKS